MTENLIQAIVNLSEKEAMNILQSRLQTGEDPLAILADTRQAMEIVGKKFETGEYFIPELLYSSEILKQITEITKPRLTGDVIQKKPGKVIIGTVAGDIHDIGKDIAAFMLEINGFQVFNLGVDVPAEKFVEKIKETGATVIGLSGFLTLSFDAMKETVEAIKTAGVRDKVKIMIGGGLVNEKIKEYTGTDAYGADAMAGVNLAKKWIGGN